MSKGSGNNRRGGGKNSRTATYAKAIEAYRHFIEGGSADLVGEIDPDGYVGFLWDGEKRADVMEKVFTPAEKDITTYKGMSEEMVDYLFDKTGVDFMSQMEGKSFVDKFYSSTSLDKGTARFYSSKALDNGKAEVMIKFNIKKGTPVADTRKLLGTGGMKGMEQEITLRRNLRYRIKKARMNKDGSFEFEIDVSKL